MAVSDGGDGDDWRMAVHAVVAVVVVVTTATMTMTIMDDDG